MRFDRAKLKDKLKSCAKETESGDHIVFSDSDITLKKIGEGHAEEWTETGRLSLIYRDGEFILSAAGHEFHLEGIPAMTMVLAVRIVFCDKSGYYEYLRSRPEIEMLLLGQHMAELSAPPLSYSFSESAEYLEKNEYKLLGKAIVEGAKTGCFDAIAHPDRIFRRCNSWDSDMEKMSEVIIQSAINVDIPVEMNLASAENPIYYKKQFWALVPDFVQRIVGYDAHFIDEVKSRYAAISRHLMAFGE